MKKRNGQQQLEVGDVVRRERRGGADRGVVIIDAKTKDRTFRFREPVPKGDYVIFQRPGVWTVGNVDDDWALIPRDEWSHSEALLHARVTWKPEKIDPPEQQAERAIWAEVVALYEKVIRDDMEDGDWPTGIDEALEWLARDLDERGTEMAQLAARVAELETELADQRHMHEAFRPEAVAEIAVQLTDESVFRIRWPIPPPPIRR